MAHKKRDMYAEMRIQNVNKHDNSMVWIFCPFKSCVSYKKNQENPKKRQEILI